MLYQLLPYATDFDPYDLTHVLAQTQLLFFAMLAFVWLNLQGIYPPEKVAINLDSEWLYHKFLRGIAQRHYPTGKGAVTPPTGNMEMYIAILLAAYLWLLLSFPH